MFTSISCHGDLWLHFAVMENQQQGDPVHSEGDQPWDFFGRNDAKADKKMLKLDFYYPVVWTEAPKVQNSPVVAPDAHSPQ